MTTVRLCKKITRTSPCICLRKPHEAPPPKKNIYTVCTLWPRDGFPGKSACFPSAIAVSVLLDLPLLLRQVPGLFQDALRCDALLLQVLPLPTGPGNDAGPELLGLVMKNTWWWYGWDGNINGNISGNISGNIIEHKYIYICVEIKMGITVGIMMRDEMTT